MKMLQVAHKTLLEAWREPQLTVLLMLFPALLIAIYFYGYGQSGQGMAQLLNVQVVNLDAGAGGTRLMEAIRDAKFDGEPVFKITAAASRSEAEVALRESQSCLLLVIPANFSARLAQTRQIPADLLLVGDPANDLYIFTQSFITGTVQAFVDQASGWTLNAPLEYTFVPGTGTLNDFQLGVPGLLVFGLLFGSISTALFMVREETHGTLKRLRLTRLSSFDLLGGVLIAQAVLSLLQMFLSLGFAVWFGFQSPGNLLLVALLGVLVSLIASSCGFLTACFSHNDGEAANFAMVFLAPLAFLSGSVFPLPAAPLFEIGGRVFQVYDLLPTSHATTALRRVLIYGDGLPQVLLETVVLLVFTGLFLLVGTWIYRRTKLS
jgi:ABC-2 type transport system permease protein